jgi:hypothetical protein
VKNVYLVSNYSINKVNLNKNENNLFDK